MVAIALIVLIASAGASVQVKTTATAASQNIGPITVQGNHGTIGNWAGVRFHVSNIDGTEVDVVNNIGTVTWGGVLPGATPLLVGGSGTYFDPSWANSGTGAVVRIGEITFHALGTGGGNSEFTDIVIAGTPIRHVQASAVLLAGQSVLLPASLTYNQLEVIQGGDNIRSVPAARPGTGHFSPVVGNTFHVQQNSVLYITGGLSTLLNLGLDHGGGAIPEPTSISIWGGCGLMFGLVGLFFRRRRLRVS
jgi:hypothetical protein